MPQTRRAAHREVAAGDAFKLPSACTDTRTGGFTMAQASSIERRRYPRINLQVPIRLSTIDPELDPWTGRPFFRS